MPYAEPNEIYFPSIKDTTKNKKTKAKILKMYADTLELKYPSDKFHTE